MKINLLGLILCVFIMRTMAYAESQADLPQARSNNEAKSLSYLQRAYFSLEQALFYTEKSRSAKSLQSFDYGKLIDDIGHIEKDLGTYIYPRDEKLTGATPFKIDGDYFLEDILKEK